ncbi:Plant invertase/pectin methylesterase inhibitor superfamily protein [Forsythia ovata]|uniref:Plant invertase/pectin methylesterase inhibitor superfamily protein n=1 Tax=Forsythia ovata TaxID=205694 RepID=A0ABD1WKH4_9LAMI
MESFSSNILAALLFLLAFTTSMDSASAARPTAGGTNTEFIRTSCSATTYPKLCYTSLSTHAAAVRQDSKLLAHTALSVTLDSARSTSTMMGKLSHISGMRPREIGAMQDCVEELSDSVDQLSRSMKEMNEIKGSNFGMIMSDVQTWVSAAMTDEDTCMEGFAGKVMNGKVKTAVREKIVNVAHLTSNALALINSYAALHN